MPVPIFIGENDVGQEARVNLLASVPPTYTWSCGCCPFDPKTFDVQIVNTHHGRIAMCKRTGEIYRDLQCRIYLGLA